MRSKAAWSSWSPSASSEPPQSLRLGLIVAFAHRVSSPFLPPSIIPIGCALAHGGSWPIGPGPRVAPGFLSGLPLWRYERIVETSDLPLVAFSNQNQTLHRAMLTCERARWGSKKGRNMGQDYIVRKLPSLYQLEVGAATLVDRVEDSLVSCCDRFLPAKVISPNSDEVRFGAEGFAKRPTVGLVPGSFEATD